MKTTLDELSCARVSPAPLKGGSGALASHEPMKLERYLSEMRNHVDRALEGYLIGSDDVSPDLADAMRYAVFPGGKRLRPILTLACAETLGAEIKDAMPVACAIELIHSYSLIHDDLPCMDNDDMRRGRPTLHRVFGEALAVLAGDALIPLAFEIVASQKKGKLKPGTMLTIIQELAAASGARALVGGQALDIAASGGGLVQEPAPRGADGRAAVQKVAGFKTGRLIEAACRCGALVAGARGDALEKISGYGRSLGLAFQIADDLQDLAQDASGASASRGASGKTATDAPFTYPGLYGIDESRRMVGDLIAKAKEDVVFLDERAWVLLGLADKVLARAEGAS